MSMAMNCSTRMESPRSPSKGCDNDVEEMTKQVQLCDPEKVDGGTGVRMKTRMMGYLDALSCNWALLGSAGLYWTVVDCTGLHWAIIDYT